MKKTLSLVVAGLCLTAAAARGQLLLADDFNATGNGSGFLLGEGVNTGINPPTTRLTGSTATDLRYIHTATGTAATAYGITGDKLEIPRSAGSGRFTLSADGITPFDFAPALGIGNATVANPVVYDIALSMANSVSGTTRFSFALATAENNANFWDFGIQLYRAVNTDTFYQIGKRIDVTSYTSAVDSTGTTGDLNEPAATTGAGTYGNEINFLMRVTDAGAETSGTEFNSRLQVSLDGGSSWIYDTDTDTDLPDGWRLDGSARYLSWDQAGAASGTGAFTYDNFSVTLVTPAVPEPSAIALGLLGAAAMLLLVRRRQS
jgi:hypothetical protein